MSDTRPHHPVTAPRPDVSIDAEEAPTGVINRITGEWSIPSGDGPPPAPPEAPDSVASPFLDVRPPAPRPGAQPHGTEYHSTQSPDAGNAGEDTAVQAALRPDDLPPLPVRTPRRRQAADFGPPPGYPAASQGFDYFSATGNRGRTGSPPRAEGTGPLPPAEASPAAPVSGWASEWPDTDRTDASLAAPGRQPGGFADTFGPSPAGLFDRPSEPVDRPGDGPRHSLFDRGVAGAGGPTAPAWGDGTAGRVGTAPPPPTWAEDAGVPAPGPAQQPADIRQQHPGRSEDQAVWADPEPEPAPRAKRPREPYLDNVKFLLIALVPLGHALVPTLAASSARATYLFIYVFHMPLFVIISGYLSKNFWNSNAKTNKLVDTFLVPYVIVEVGYAALRYALGQKWSITIIDPAWLNWYLLALLFWRLSTPVWKRMRHPLVIAVIVYLVAGLSELPGDFSMDRFFGLMPFFVLGLVIKPGLFEFLARPWVRGLSVLTLLGAAGVAIYLVKNYTVQLGPIYYKNSYQDLDLVWWEGMILRTALLIAALVMSAAVLSLVPRQETWFTDLGTRTLYCYLLHGVPVLIAKEMGWLSVPWLYGPLGVATIASASFALAIVLCLPVTRTLFRWLLEPRLTWLYRKPAVPAR